MICGVLTDTVVICHRVGPVSRRLHGGYSVCCVIHGQDAVSCTKKELVHKNRENEKRNRTGERGTSPLCSLFQYGNIGWLSLN